MPLIEPSIFCNISGSKAGSECGLTLNCTVLLLLFAYKLNNFASAFEIFPVEFHFPSPSQLPGATWSYTCYTLSCKEQQWATLSNTELSYTELINTELINTELRYTELTWRLNIMSTERQLYTPVAVSTSHCNTYTILSRYDAVVWRYASNNNNNNTRLVRFSEFGFCGFCNLFLCRCVPRVFLLQTFALWAFSCKFVSVCTE